MWALENCARSGWFADLIAPLFFEQEVEQCHPDRHAIGGLLEIDSTPVFIDLCRKLVDARQGMHDHSILETPLIEKFGTDARIATAGRAVLHALLLFTRHVQRIVAQTRNHRRKLCLNSSVDLSEQC